MVAEFIGKTSYGVRRIIESQRRVVVVVVWWKVSLNHAEYCITRNVM